MVFLLLISVFLFSCSTIENPSLENNLNTESKWICYHPNTKFHNKVCVEKEFPEGCYVSGDKGKFCWLLSLSDCYDEVKSENIKDVCEVLDYNE